MMFHIYKELSEHGHQEPVEDMDFSRQEAADKFCETENNKPANKKAGLVIFAEPFTVYRLFRSDNPDGTGGQSLVKEIPLASDKDALLYITGADMTVEALEGTHTRIVKEAS